MSLRTPLAGNHVRCPFTIIYKSHVGWECLRLCEEEKRCFHPSRKFRCVVTAYLRSKEAWVWRMNLNGTCTIKEIAWIKSTCPSPASRGTRWAAPCVPRPIGKDSERTSRWGSGSSDCWGRVKGTESSIESMETRISRGGGLSKGFLKSRARIRRRLSKFYSEGCPKMRVAISSNDRPKRSSCETDWPLRLPPSLQWTSRYTRDQGRPSTPRRSCLEISFSPTSEPLTHEIQGGNWLQTAVKTEIKTCLVAMVDLQ